MKRTTANLIYSLWDMFCIRLDRLISTTRSQITLRFQGCPPGKSLQTTGSCHFKARHAASIIIGNHVNLGGNVRIFDHDFHALDSEVRRAS